MSTEHSDPAYLEWYTIAREACERRFGPEFRRLCWGSMIYACENGDFEHRVLLGVGVEGPPDMKRVNETIPCPFYCGKCPNCGGHLSHDRWNEDEEWEPRPVTDRQAYFYVPSRRRAKSNAQMNYGGAEYGDPTGKTTPPPERKSNG